MTIADLALKLLQRLEPERAHALTLHALRLGLAPRQRQADDPALATHLFGQAIPNPVGIAAGFDKHAEAPDALLALGFGFVEVGGVTPLPQPGNPRPRLFRLPEDGAVINRFGLNSVGVDVVAARLERRRGRAGLVGVNLGANKESADRAGDYVTGLRRLASLAGFLTVNVSSPNTPGLRALQGRDELDALLGRVLAARAELGSAAPVVLKIAPDLADADRQDIAAVALARNLDGMIVSNTTIARDGLRSPHAREAGGLSGRPLFARATALLREMHQATGGRIVLIGAGGVASGADAYAKIRAGASAVQLYTALTYGGLPLLVAIKRDLAALLRADGFTSVADAVGR